MASFSCLRCYSKFIQPLSQQQRNGSQAHKRSAQATPRAKINPFISGRLVVPHSLGTTPRQPLRSSPQRFKISAAGNKPVLYDMPVSNNGANIRLIIYWKGLEDAITITSPMDLGGLKSPEYLKLNPQGKMPLLVLPDGVAFPESAVIANYIADKYASSGPSLIPSTPEARATANLATRVHDIYIASGLQGCMYKSMDIEERATKMAELAKQLDVLEGIVEGSPYVVGDTPSLADAALFPTFVFFTYILPSQFGWTDVFASRPKLKAWWEHMCKDDSGKRVLEEVLGGLEEWAANDRWNKLGIAEQVKDTNYKWAY